MLKDLKIYTFCTKVSTVNLIYNSLQFMLCYCTNISSCSIIHYPLAKKLHFVVKTYASEQHIRYHSARQVSFSTLGIIRQVCTKNITSVHHTSSNCTIRKWGKLEQHRKKYCSHISFPAKYLIFASYTTCTGVTKKAIIR